MIDSATNARLTHRALWVRRQVLRIAARVKAGHVTTAFSQCEMLCALYYGGLLRNIDPKHPKRPDRDRFILSKGQGGLGLYPILADFGFFPLEWLDHYAERGNLLGTHAEWNVPGVEIISGSLGHGLPIATGIAHALKQDGNPARVVVMTGDAELYEGSNWEAMFTAAHLRLDNLVLIVDRNGQGTIGKTDPRDGVESASDGPQIESLIHKLRAFGFDAVECEGNSFDDVPTPGTPHVGTPGIIHAWDYVVLRSAHAGPRAIIARTVKGKGCSVFEDKRLWHYRAPAGDDLAGAARDLGLDPQTLLLKDDPRAEEY